MRSLLALAFLGLLATSAHAQQAVNLNCQNASGVFSAASPTNPCSTATTATTPAVVGFGTLAVVNASALLSTLTVGPNSGVWPTAPAQVYVKNSEASAGKLYVCPLGGTCSAATGLVLGAGAAWGFYKPSTSMTVFADSTATAAVQW